MKNILIVLLFLTVNSFSQGLFNSYEKGKIYFRNNTELEGFIKKTMDDEIKFKKTLKEKKQLYNYKTVKKVVFIGDNKTLYYKRDNHYVYLLEKQINGKLDLYYKQVYSPGVMGANGMMMGGHTNTTYFIGKINSDYVEELPNNVSKKKFWLIFSKYIADCKYIIEKVKDKKSIKKNFKKKSTRLFNMINDYNSHCK